jgi:hypothetical protein
VRSNQAVFIFFSVRQSEMEALSGSSDFSEFYERLKVTKEHHRKYPNEPVEPPEMEYIYLSQKKEDTDYEGKHNNKERARKITNSYTIW